MREITERDVFLRVFVYQKTSIELFRVEKSRYHGDERII